MAHRRAGKTVACVADLQDAALRCKLERPRFAYLAPYLKQAKTVAWDYLRAGIVPLRALGAQVNESELRVDYGNGGQVRLYGADNADALRGIYLDGVVLDEFADMDPRVWSEVIRPALADRKGWAVFIGTPKGRNEFFDIYKRSQSESDWFSLMLKASETGLIDRDELDLARRDLTDEQYAQEFECSFEAAVVGAYYGKRVIVENRPGAGGLIGNMHVSKASADGHTLGMVDVTRIITELMRDPPPYRALADIIGVTHVASITNVLAVTPKIITRNANDFVAFTNGYKNVFNIECFH